MKKESWENLTFAGHIEGKKSREKQQIILYKLMLKQEQGIIKDKNLEQQKNRKWWRTMITHVLKGNGI